MQRIDGNHGRQKVRVAGRQACIGPAGEDSGETLDGGLIVVWNRQAFHRNLCSILIQFVHTDGKELEDFPGIILVGHTAFGGVRLRIINHVEIHAHGWFQRHFPQKIGVGAERVRIQHLLVGAHSSRVIQLDE